LSLEATHDILHRMPELTPVTRRDMLRSAGMLAGGALVARFSSVDLSAADQAAATTQAGIDALNGRRAEMAKAPIARTKLGDRVVLLSGPGGNVVVLHGPDGLVLVDGFVKPVWPTLKSILDEIGGPLKFLIDTHWHFDHADNNGNFRQAGGTIVAHQNTKTRLSQTHDVLGMHFDPEPPAALPTEMFRDMRELHANGEDFVLQYIPPAHTDTDIYVHFKNANVLHLGDVFFNGTYPFIDASTGGNMNGMVAAAERALAVSDAQTKIVPGHGPLADRAALQRYRTMLSTIRDRVHTLKSSGKPLPEVQATKPSAEFDAEWGTGFMKPDDFVALVYSTLR
jgi:cyclase